MDDQKQKIADDIKLHIQQLQAKIDHAETLGLSVEIDVPSKSRIGRIDNDIAVKIFENVTY